MDRVLKAARSSGSLNLSNRSLRYRQTLHRSSFQFNLLFHWRIVASSCREVPDEVYRNLEGLGSDDKWWEVLYLLLSFPFSSGSIRIMKMIDNNAIAIWTKLRNEMWSCHLCYVVLQAAELQKLVLAHNCIESLKEDIKNLPFLVVLNLSHNSLSQLPAAIGEWVFFSCFSLFLRKFEFHLN